MFEAGNLVAGVAVAGSTDRLDLIDNDTIDAADLTGWLSQAATENGHSSPYLYGDTELDRDTDITDFKFLAANFASEGYGASAVPEPSSLLLTLLGLILLSISWVQ